MDDKKLDHRRAAIAETKKKYAENSVASAEPKPLDPDEERILNIWFNHRTYKPPVRNPKRYPVREHRPARSAYRPKPDKGAAPEWKGKAKRWSLSLPKS